MTTEERIIELEKEEIYNKTIQEQIADILSRYPITMNEHLFLLTLFNKLTHSTIKLLDLTNDIYSKDNLNVH